MNCKNYMWLKFVKGLSSEEKCKFSRIYIAILYIKKLFGKKRFLYQIHSLFYRLKRLNFMN